MEKPIASENEIEDVTLYSLGGFTYNLSISQLLDSNGNEVKLRPKPRQVLEVLLRAHGNPVKREKISDVVWADVIVTDDALTQCIKDLRNTLGDSDRSLLRTLPKVGYQINAIPSQQIPDTAFSRHFLSKSMVLAGCAVIVLCIFLVVGKFVSKANKATVTRNPAITIQQFESLADDDRWNRLAFGLSLEVGSELSNRKILTVHAVDEEDQISPEFNGFILRGTLQPDKGENLQVLAQLIDAENSNEVIWNRRWNRPLEDYFQIQSEIVKGIDSTLTPFWSGKINEVIVSKIKGRDRDLNAYELYLKGIEQKHRFTPNSYKKSEHFLLRALEIDPEFSEAWTTLAVVYLNLGINAKTLSEKKLYVEKRASATARAFELAPENPDTLVQWSWLNAHQGNWSESETAMRKAVLHAGNDSDVLGVAALAGSQYVSLGSDAVEWSMRAVHLRAPYPLWYNLAVGIASFHDDNFQQAESYLNNAPNMIQKFLYLSATRQMLNDAAGAAESREELKLINSDFTIDGYAKSVAMGPALAERLKTLGNEAGIPVHPKDPWLD